MGDIFWNGLYEAHHKGRLINSMKGGKSMKIGIIVYSKTGNTLSVAEKLGKTLTEAGHDAVIQRVKVNKDEKGSSGKLSLTANPDVSNYDAVVFAAPVHALSLASAMKLYLNQVKDLSDKKVYGFVTQHFMGGSCAIRKLKSLCQEKGADLKTTGIVNWAKRKRENQIEQIITKFSSI
jgi:flavodoxin